MARLATILSFGDHADDDTVPELATAAEHYRDEQEHDADDDAASDASDDSFEFAFARPLVQTPEADALADDLFAHGRIVPAYPVFRRQHSNPHHDDASSSAAMAPPSPDTYCAWTPRSAPGSPARELAAFPKSASTGQSVPRFRIRDLVSAGAGRRSHSDGKEKFLFLQPSPAKPKLKSSAPPAAAAAAAPAAPATKKPSSQPKTKQSKKKGAAVTEMDMATAHRLFYSKPGSAAASATGTERPSTATKKSYLPYRPAIVGFFAAAHGLRPKHHPY